MSYYGKNVNISTDYINIYNSWCHFSGDSYFTQNKYNKLSFKNGPYLYGLANLSSNDTWRTMATFDFYTVPENSSTLTQISCIAAGALPSFGHNFWSKTEPYYVEEVRENEYIGTYTVEVSSEIPCSRSDTILVIGDTTYTAVNFRDNFIPRFVIAAVQGAGGGGGGTQLSDDGTGGGAGGFICGVIKLPSSFVIKVGEGGNGGGFWRGGQYAHVVMGDDNGVAGEDSYISSNNTVILKAFGGTGGPKSTQSESATPGQGGSFTYGSSAYCISGRTGGNGGKVYGLQNATGCAALTAKATASSSYSTIGAGSGLTFYKTWPATSGGAQGDYNAPGGGGGSMLSSGPAGGGYMSDGNPGSLGAGGSGARYTFITYKQGGRGGDGAVYLWY